MDRFVWPRRVTDKHAILVLFALIMVFALVMNWHYSTGGFIPNRTWTTLGAILGVVFSVWATRKALTEELAVRTRPMGAVRTAMLWPVVAGPLFYFFWIVCVCDIPRALTGAFGAPVSRFATVNRDYVSNVSSGRRRAPGCAYQLVGDVLNDASPPYYCLSRLEYDQFPRARSVRVKLQARLSLFGYRVTGYTFDGD